ncbi:cyclic nucleotide-binding domain-containing protein [Yoonia sediminilitoris]|uniref:SulP family sulfate permease n=1 Tax=Yoonia sediminilitoris TaxID=1286148 RepID=A0A2T6K832_9RHOB|nr:cyclic nucleotide-binding domain-containing protein [Yoonia sediminilitoris]PUB10910.1 SulP family sulfate permease [Yoonia sediminilitoris]RCW90585.1 SulP family sulfate permease [Yoonia sediminilitoris]
MSYATVRDLRTVGRDLLSDLFAGGIVAASNLALAASFAAAIFQGTLEPGIATAVWAILLSMIIIGPFVGWHTTLRPIAAGGPDTAVVAVMSLLAGKMASTLFEMGLPTEIVVSHIMLSISLVAVIYALILFVIGYLGWARALRFVPFPLIGGFLAATGLLLLKGSPEIVLGSSITFDTFGPSMGAGQSHQLWFMLGYSAFLLISHHMIRSPLVMPLSFFAAVAAIYLMGLTGMIDGTDWFVASMRMTPWEPIAAINSGQIYWGSILGAYSEITACVLVGILSLVVRISTIESMREASADIDQEFRTYGSANLIAAPFGATSGGILFSTSKLIQVAGYRSRFCYIVTVVLLAPIVFWGADLSALLPKPVLGGLLLYLGYTMSLEAVRVVFRQSGLNLIAALAIFILCLKFGFLVGALFGLLVACLIFAIDCSRTGVVRHHFTRAEVSGGTEWPAHLEKTLRERGKAVHVFELSGYIFFGSSEKLFDEIRAQVLSQTDPKVAFILLDLSRVSGFDSTAVNTLIKLQSLAVQNNIWVVYCGSPKTLEAAIAKAGVLIRNKNAVKFGSLIDGVFWCEQRLLEADPIEKNSTSGTTFTDWISIELGSEVSSSTLKRYFQEKHFACGDQVYTQGTRADTIDFICTGSVSMSLKTQSGPQVIRRATRRTVIGEMGFFRQANRSVSIFAAENLTLYSLSLEAMAEMEKKMPELHARLLTFIVRVLCDRLDMANHEISALR